MKREAISNLLRASEDVYRSLQSNRSPTSREHAGTLSSKIALTKLCTICEVFGFLKALEGNDFVVRDSSAFGKQQELVRIVLPDEEAQFIRDYVNDLFS